MRDDLTAAVDVLARSACVELQSHAEPSAPLRMRECRDLLEEFDTLQSRFGHYWPARPTHWPDERHEPYAMLELAMNRLRAWSAEAVDVVDRIEMLRHERDDLLLLRELFGDGDGSLPELQQFTSAGPLLKSCVYVLESDAWPKTLPHSAITQRITTPGHNFLLALGLPEEIAALEDALKMQKAQQIRLPDGLPGKSRDAGALINERVDAANVQIAEARRELTALDDRHEIASTLAVVDFLRWYVDNVPDLASTENFAWITGWSSAPDEDSLVRLLADANIKALLRLAEPPGGFDAPLLLHNPKWMRPFEMFTSMLGVPAAGEADPTRIVAIASPLMFGFMFGDVGHGAVVLLAGIFLSRRLPALRLLIAGGVVSIGFGFLFGSIFGLENVIRPLWIHPMEQPILMLLIALAGGAVLLLIGLCLDAMQAYWQRKGLHWWETGAGLLLCYLALLGSIREPRLLWLAIFGGAWFVIGHAFVALPGRRFAASGKAAAEFVETLLQLLVNTISFVRVGAFALAHAGLSLAVVGVAEAPASLAGKILILVIGNALIIALEGLVVGIQTTRLVLFEFFVRFLRAEGRPFRPIPLPTSNSPEHHRRPS